METTGVIDIVELTRTFREPRRLASRTASPERVALDRLTLRIEPGECVALVGPNGAGKSTLLRILATTVAPTAGDAYVVGHSVAAHPEAVRREIGVMTGDDRSFFWRLTGLENLLFFAKLQGLAARDCRPRCEALLERLGLADARNQRFTGYSAGMRARLAIARAVLHEPRVLLLDEPTASLDLDHRRQALDLLRESLRADGAALIASHDAGLAAALAHRVVRLEHGRVVSTRRSSDQVAYRVRIRGISLATASSLGEDLTWEGECATISVLDLGDGHALAATLAGVVAAGGEIIDVAARAAALILPDVRP